MRRILTSLRDNKRAATAIEYALIAALIAVACAGAIQLFASRTTTMWNDVASQSLKNL
ncbi:MAG: Flp family type IVb pilin [Sphingopyxis sp.]